jgi:hypothetical protein
MVDPVGRLVAVRANALAHGDRNLVRECETQLARYGWTPDQPETTEARAVDEAAVPPRPRRGRPPKAR